MNLTIKFILLGETSVGKTSLFYKCIYNKFPENFQSTIGVDSQIKGIEFKGYKINAHIFDTAGQEKFHSITKLYLRNTHGFFLVFDLTNRNSLNELNNWIEEIKSAKNNKIDNNIIILGNKKDLNDLIVIKDEEIKEFEKNTGFKIIQTSAKTGEGINEAFDAMLELIFGSKSQEEIYNEFIPHYKYKKLINKKKKKKNKIAHCC